MCIRDSHKIERRGRQRNMGPVSYTHLDVYKRQAQLIGTLIGVGWAVTCGVVVYAGLKATLGLRLSQEEEYDGADLSIHRIGATPEREVNW